METQYKVTSKNVLVRVESDLFDGWVKCKTLDELKTYAGEEGEACEVPADAKEGLVWKEEAMMPPELFDRVLGTIQKFPTMETAYLLYRNPATGEYDVKAPSQYGGGAAVKFFEEPHTDTGFRFFGTIHTHPEMGAFWSGTDLADQRAKPNTFHIVFGLHNGHVTAYKASFFGYGEQHDFRIEDFVSGKVDFEADNDPDDSWVEIIRRQDYKVPEVKVKTTPAALFDSKGVSSFYSKWCGAQAAGNGSKSVHVADRSDKPERAVSLDEVNEESLIDDVVDTVLVSADPQAFLEDLIVELLAKDTRDEFLSALAEAMPVRYFNSVADIINDAQTVAAEYASEGSGLQEDDLPELGHHVKSGDAFLPEYDDMFGMDSPWDRP